jgi:L-2,4-diaminobutyric acid acetyltransferase
LRSVPEQTDSLSGGDEEPLTFRQPAVEDGAAMWALAKATGGLDMNSPYAYLMVGAYMGKTSIVAEDGDRLAGFISGFAAPEKPDTLFVWQVGVDPAQRGRKIATRMLLALLRRPGLNGIRFVETTVTPSNAASLALFNGLARHMGGQCDTVGQFGRTLFPGDGHEEELVLRIGPFGAADHQGVSP